MNTPSLFLADSSPADPSGGTEPTLPKNEGADVSFAELVAGPTVGEPGPTASKAAAPVSAGNAKTRPATGTTIGSSDNETNTQNFIPDTSLLAALMSPPLQLIPNPETPGVVEEEGNALIDESTETAGIPTPIPGHAGQASAPLPAVMSSMALLENNGTKAESFVGRGAGNDIQPLPVIAIHSPVPAESAEATGSNAMATLGLEPVSERENLTVQLREAMARLEEAAREPSSASAAAAKSAESAEAQRQVDSKIIPFPGATRWENKIVPVDFKPEMKAGMGAQPQPQAVPESATVGDNPATQLPTGHDHTENSAGSSPPGVPLERVVQIVEKGRQSTGSTRSTPGGPPVSEPESAGGTSAARKKKNMESRTLPKPPGAAEGTAGVAFAEGSEHTAQPPRLDGSIRYGANEWPPAFQTGATEPAALEISVPVSRSPDAAAAVERISKLVQRETALFRQHGSDSMAVILRPDAGTELVLHLSQNNGQLEANVRCERGDFQQLNALWSQLQESLSHQKVRLAPLQEATPDSSHFRNQGGSQQGGDESSRQPRPDYDSMDEWPASVSLSNDPAVRSRRDSGRRLSSTSRPGWETWA
jgi:hypothetical protein